MHFSCFERNVNIWYLSKKVWFRKMFYKLQEWLAAQGDESSVCVVSGDQVLTPILVFVYYFGF